MQACLDQGGGIVHVHTAGSDHADGFQVLGSPDAAESPLTGGIAPIVHQTAQTALVLAGWPDAHDCRTVGRSIAVEAVWADPIPIGVTVGDVVPYGLLAFLCFHPPEGEVGAISYLHVIVADIDPHRTVGFSLQHNPIPAGVFQHRRKPAAEIASREPAIGIGLNADALHLGSAPGGWNRRSAEGRGHHGEDIGGVKTVNSLVLDQIEEDRRAHTVSAHPVL